MNVPEHIEFRTIEDLHTVPIESLQAFLVDLGNWMAICKVGAAMGMPAKDAGVFKLINDGKHEVFMRGAPKPSEEVE